MAATAQRRQNLTDRAKRYRAQHPSVRPANPKRCGYCWSAKNVGIDHVNGRESDGAPENLMWACKSCNAIKANVLKGAGLGTRVAQYNPKGRSKREQLEEYGIAIKVMRGLFDGDVAKAVATIRATPPELRSEYNRQAWKFRHRVYGKAGRGGNPFGFGRTTYSAATKIKRPVLGDKKAERKLRALERREARRLLRKESGGSAAPAKKAAAKKTPAPAKSKMPALFGVPYEKLTPAQQELVRKAGANPAGPYTVDVQGLEPSKHATLKAAAQQLRKLAGEAGNSGRGFDVKHDATGALVSSGRMWLRKGKGELTYLGGRAMNPKKKQAKPAVDYIITPIPAWDGGGYELRRKLGTGSEVIGRFETYEQANAARKQDWAARKASNPDKGTEYEFGFIAGQSDRDRAAAQKSSAQLKALFESMFKAGSLERFKAGYAAGRKGKAANPGKGSFARCVKAVSKRGGVDDPSAVCAASKGRTAAGLAELLRAARAGKRAAMSANKPFLQLDQGSLRADVYQVAPGQYYVAIGDEVKEFKTFKAARQWARLRLFERSNPAGVRVRAIPVDQYKRRNPSIQAALKQRETFTGLPSDEVLEIVERTHYHPVTFALGALISMIVQPKHGQPFRLRSADPQNSKLEQVTFLSCTLDGKQLIPAGGDQGFKLETLRGYGFNERDERDHMLLGELTQVEYRTKKIFESDGKELIDFYHDLGKEHSRGRLPVLIYKPRDPSLEIAGGRYFIAPPEAALNGVSPGLVG